MYAKSVWPIGQELVENAAEVGDVLARGLVAVVAGVVADVLEPKTDPGISTAAQSHSQLSYPFLPRNLG